MTEKPTLYSAEWYKLRDSNFREWIGNEDALNAFLLLTDAAHFFDDLYDKDKFIAQEDVVDMAFTCMVELPLNPFIRQCGQSLLPQVNMAIQAWRSANKMEQPVTDEKTQEGRKAIAEQHTENLQRAYMLRSLYCLWAKSIIEITRGRKYLELVDKELNEFLFPETMEEYMNDLVEGKGNV